MILANDKATNAIRLDEKTNVEEPFLAQLDTLGWKVIRLGAKQAPGQSFRADFGQVVLLPKLEEALRRINPFLQDEQVTEVVGRITSFPHSNLIENNRYVLNLLLENTSVAVNHDTGERSPTVRYIDFQNRKNNSFIAVSQFKVSVPGTNHYIILDVVLFLNGLPVVVVECKSARLQEPIAEAIDQLLRYSHQRREGQEGNEELFYYNQFLVVTCRQRARFATITTHLEKHFFPWTDPYPLTLDDLAHHGTLPNDQQRLVAGMCAKKNLLSLIESFTIFGTNDQGKVIKILARYHQFRAVKRTVRRLLAGQNRRERSGVIWHTPGSGKSLTMLFMVREMRRQVALRDWKVILVTGRTQLKNQLSKSGQAVKVAEWINPNPDRPGLSFKELLATDSPDLVIAMINKFQVHELQEIFPELNPSPSILVMVEETHHPQDKFLEANLDRAMPHAAWVVYTSTSIDKNGDTLGDHIDKYTMQQAIEDGVMPDLVYEDHSHNVEAVDDKQ